MRTGYLPILIFGALVGAFAVLSLAASSLIRPRRPLRAKYEPYESGITPFRLPRASRFPVKFYVVAMLFIIFDIETIFLFPWAVSFRRLGLFGLVEMVVFIGLVFVAYVYVWQKGGLEWEGPRRLATTAGAAHAADGAAYRGLPPEVERSPGDAPLPAPAAWGRAEEEPAVPPAGTLPGRPTAGATVRGGS